MTKEIKKGKNLLKSEVKKAKIFRRVLTKTKNISIAEGGNKYEEHSY